MIPPSHLDDNSAPRRRRPHARARAYPLWTDFNVLLGTSPQSDSSR
jgi:hypothetical protein